MNDIIELVKRMERLIDEDKKASLEAMLITHTIEEIKYLQGKVIAMEDFLALLKREVKKLNKETLFDEDY